MNERLHFAPVAEPPAETDHPVVQRMAGVPAQVVGRLQEQEKRLLRKGAARSAGEGRRPHPAGKGKASANGPRRKSGHGLPLVAVRPSRDGKQEEQEDERKSSHVNGPPWRGLRRTEYTPAGRINGYFLRPRFARRAAWCINAVCHPAFPGQPSPSCSPREARPCTRGPSATAS